MFGKKTCTIVSYGVTLVKPIGPIACDLNGSHLAILCNFGVLQKTGCAGSFASLKVMNAKLNRGCWPKLDESGAFKVRRTVHPKMACFGCTRWIDRLLG